MVTLKPAYTKFFKDVYNTWDVQHFLTPTGFWADEGRFLRLCNMILDKYRLWEVFIDNKDIFKDEFKAIFNINSEYYEERITAYETEINFLDGNKVHTDYDSTTTNTPRAQYKSEDYDLPRSETAINRPSSKRLSGGVDGVDTTGVDGSSDTHGGDVIDLKRRYLDLLRNVYEEFAIRFKPLFIELFDYKMVEEDE